MFTYIKKNVTDITMGVIAHGVNCQNAMGSGIAKAIKDQWPIAYKYYMSIPGKLLLGHCDPIPVNHELWICNCYTQEFFGGDGKRYASPDAIFTSLFKAFNFACTLHLPIYMPRIGCGLGGLHWEGDVLPIIESLNSYFSNKNIELYIIEPA